MWQQFVSNDSAASSELSSSLSETMLILKTWHAEGAPTINKTSLLIHVEKITSSLW